jgi:hypothetical protein
MDRRCGEEEESSKLVRLQAMLWELGEEESLDFANRQVCEREIFNCPSRQIDSQLMCRSNFRERGSFEHLSEKGSTVNIIQTLGRHQGIFAKVARLGAQMIFYLELEQASLRRGQMNESRPGFCYFRA